MSKGITKECQQTSQSVEIFATLKPIKDYNLAHMKNSYKWTKYKWHVTVKLSRVVVKHKKMFNLITILRLLWDITLQILRLAKIKMSDKTKCWGRYRWLGNLICCWWGLINTLTLELLIFRDPRFPFRETRETRAAPLILIYILGTTQCLYSRGVVLWTNNSEWMLDSCSNTGES